MPWTIELHETVETWFEDLYVSDPKGANLVQVAIERLAQQGPSLGRPLADHIKDSTVANLKELRPRSNPRSAIRILFAFDPQRQGVLLVAGDKAGDWERWYREQIPIAEQRFAEHCAGLTGREG